MYEGKNLHFSPVDQKPLCSFSGKICNQRRLNKYGFCVRHILEDPTAPFKRCAYVAKSSRQTCTQPIPKNEEREYCNNHMQVLGMLPKKERKPKKEVDKPPAGLVPGEPLSCLVKGQQPSGNRSKPRLTLSGFKPVLNKGHGGSGEDEDDVYAFPTDLDHSNKPNSVSTLITSIAVPDMTPDRSKTITYRARSPTESGHSSLAKIYPELAEKLEKIKQPKLEPKSKGKVKSSRTMNSLQTKIAQNKIKDKLKRNQSSSNASSQSQSPSHGFASTSSPSCQHRSCSPNVSVPSPGPAVCLVPTAPAPSVVDVQPSMPATSAVAADKTVDAKVVSPRIAAVTTSMPVSAPVTAAANVVAPQLPSLSQLNLLNTFNLQSLNLGFAQLGHPVPPASDIELTLKQLAKAANISLESGTSGESAVSLPLPIPPQLPALPATFLPHPEFLGMFRPQFLPQTGPPPPYTGVHHKPSSAVPDVAGPKSATAPVVKSVPRTSDSKVLPGVMNIPLMTVQTVPSLSHPSVVSSASALPSSLSVATASTVAQATSSSISSPLVSSSASSSSSKSSSTLSRLSSVSSLPLSTSVSTSLSFSQTVAKTIDSVKQNIAASSIPKNKTSKVRPSRSRNPSSPSKRPVPVFTLPMTMVKPRKIRRVLGDSELSKLRTQSARDYYKLHRTEREYHHDLIISGFDSSDESDLSDCDMLPWQPDWFKASSDEEAFDEDELDYDLRTTKLALTRAQLRRQCFQARRSYRANSLVSKHNNSSTSSLISAVREQASAAVRCLAEISGKQPKPVDKYKIRGLEKRTCLYKDNDDVQCKKRVVPYANHCIKHVMYNVDQQLFEYCTAKFADNTQCCHPVIDVKHELPLCMEHGLKTDNFLKMQEAEPKPKRPRKKTKPSALTRPPKKGKKKKNQRKSSRLEKPVPLVGPTEDNDAADSDDEHATASQDDEEDDDGDDDTDKEPTPAKDSPSLTKSAILRSVPSKSSLNPVKVIPMTTTQQPMVSQTAGVTIAGEARPAAPALPSVMVVSGDRTGAAVGPVGQLEELDNLGPLTELDNVKMFGDLPLETATKLLEENDFQDVLNRLPDETFDIFSSKSSGLPSNEELEELEKSLAMANREFRLTKDSYDQMSSGVESSSASQQSMASASSQSGYLTPASAQQPFLTPASSQQPFLMPASTQQPSLASATSQQPLPPILDEADELTRQIAEEILNQNIGADINVTDSVCNGDAQESIKAIARSLSNSGMMLTSEAAQRPSTQDLQGLMLQQGQSSASSRLQTTQGYSHVSSGFTPPNIVLQNLQQQSLSQPSSPSYPPQSVQSMPNMLTLNSSQISSQGHLGQGQLVAPARNVTVAHQGVLQTQLPISTVFTPVSPQTNLPVTSTAVAGQQIMAGGHGNSNPATGVLSLSGAQQLTAQQLSALIQQATLQQLPPLPPYTPRSTTPASSASMTLQVPVTKALTQEQITAQQQQLQQKQQDLLRQQQQLTQQHMLAQQLLQQHLAQLAHQATGKVGTQPMIGSQSVVSGQPVIQLPLQGSTGATGHVAKMQLAPAALSGKAGVQGLSGPSSSSVGLLGQYGQVGNQTIELSQMSRNSPQTVVPSTVLPGIGQIALKAGQTSAALTSSVVNLPSTNIVWTAPPNVTITCSNGIPPQGVPKASMSGVKVVTSVGKSVGKDAFIDLTETCDMPPPAYQLTQQALELTRTQPPPSYPTNPVTNTSVTGKT